MILARPLRARKADVPSVDREATQRESEPIVRLRHVTSGTERIGWYLDAQRSIKSDQRSQTSTRVSAHQPTNGGDWCLERGSVDGQFRVRLVSEGFSQPRGWYLDVEDEISSDVQNGQRFCDVILRKVAGSSPIAEWFIEPEEYTPGRSPVYRFLSAEAHVFRWSLNLCQARSKGSCYVRVESNATSSWLLELQTQLMALPSTKRPPVRFYEVVVRNYSHRPLSLQGAKEPALRRSVAGRFLKIQSQLPAEPGAVDAYREKTLELGLIQDPQEHRSPTIQATFDSGVAGDLLEFSATYLAGGCGIGLSIEAHANSCSSMQSFVKVHGEELEVLSVMEDVPRLRVGPPAAYINTTLGVYSGPGACDAVGKLSPGDEVMAGIGPRRGRWIKITYPVEGWVQAETRDGQAVLHEVLGTRPNLRQVVTLRSHGPRSRELPLPVEDSTSREKERAYFNARSCEATRLLREFARLESRVCKGGKPRQTVLGIF